VTENATAQARLLATLHTLDGTGAVRARDRYPTDADDLWSALTDPERLARWVADVDGDLRPGGTFQARFTSGWEGPGRVEVCEPPTRLLLTLSPGQDDETAVEALLTPDGDGTLLVIEERGLPVVELAGYGAGWQAHAEDLAGYLAGRPATAWRTRWTELAPAYRALAAGVR
jgi:uncharacterized protein YndB with AHSA1/START domain